MTPIRLLALAMVAFCGCVCRPDAHKNADAPKAVEIEVAKAQEHLGHDTSTEGVHTVWYDGCQARDVRTGEPFVIYWLNNRIASTPFRFKDGRRYAVRFNGEEWPGVMGYAGRCIDIGQVVSVEEKR